MKRIKAKEEVAEYIKVSIPTLDKYLRKHKKLLDESKIDMKKLNEIINAECSNRAVRRGR